MHVHYHPCNKYQAVFFSVSLLEKNRPGNEANAQLAGLEKLKAGRSKRGSEMDDYEAVCDYLQHQRYPNGFSKTSTEENARNTSNLNLGFSTMLKRCHRVAEIKNRR